jgi:hypothetical protein
VVGLSFVLPLVMQKRRIGVENISIHVARNNFADEQTKSPAASMLSLMI